MPVQLQQTWNTVAAFLPKFAAFLVILIIGWIIAKVLAKALGTLLHRIGFNRLLERAGVERALHNSQLDGVGLFTKVVYYGLMLIVLQGAFGVFGPNAVSNVLNQIVAFIPRAIVALIIVAIAMAVANVVKDLIVGTLGGLSYGRTVAKAVSWFIIAMGVIAALNQVGIATTVTMPVLIAVLATLSGIAIVGVGGGLIGPMRQRWENWLTSAEQESRNIKQHVAARSAGGSFGQSTMAQPTVGSSVYDVRDNTTTYNG